MRFLILFFMGYTLCYWGSTLIMGGPGGTGAWPLMYTLLKMGPAPQVPPTKKGAKETAAASAPFTAGMGNPPPPAGGAGLIEQ